MLSFHDTKFNSCLSCLSCQASSLSSPAFLRFSDVQEKEKTERSFATKIVAEEYVFIPRYNAQLVLELIARAIWLIEQGKKINE